MRSDPSDRELEAQRRKKEAFKVKSDTQRHREKATKVMTRSTKKGNAGSDSKTIATNEETLRKPKGKQHVAGGMRHTR